MLAATWCGETLAATAAFPEEYETKRQDGSQARRGDFGTLILISSHAFRSKGIILSENALLKTDLRVHIMSADAPEAHGRAWLQQQGEIGRGQAQDSGKQGSVLVVDEIQKVPALSETVKRLWDEDTASRTPLKLLILGSAPLLIHQGLLESLADRFEVVRSTHWSFAEMRDAFGWSLDQYIFFGGYPGSAGLIGDETRWKRYILDSMVETTLSRDILQLQRIDKPALLRQLFSTSDAHIRAKSSRTRILLGSFKMQETRQRLLTTSTCSAVRE